MTVGLGRRLAIQNCVATAFLTCVSAPALALQHRPELFFYPPAIRLEDGSILASPITIDSRQIAEAFPQIEEMAGVVLALYWSQIEPSAGNFDFSIIEHVFSFWKEIGKKIVLDVATVGYPMYRVENGKAVMKSATPADVLLKVETFIRPVRAIWPLGHPDKWRQLPTILPSYFDAQFLVEVSKMVNALARFDGDPTLSKVRIATGIGSEDNPTFDGLKSRIPGWSNRAWLVYCRHMTDIYLQNFSRTQLEFDLDRVGWVYALGTDADRADADQFIDYLQSKHVFLAVDGLDTANITAWRIQQTSSGIARDFQYLQEQHAAGRAIGLEAGHTFSNPLFTDADVIAAAVLAIGADRLVLFADAPATLNFRRFGLTPQNEITISIMAPAVRQSIADRAERLLTLIGYNES